MAFPLAGRHWNLKASVQRYVEDLHRQLRQAGGRGGRRGGRAWAGCGGAGGLCGAAGCEAARRALRAGRRASVVHDSDQSTERAFDDAERVQARLPQY